MLRLVDFIISLAAVAPRRLRETEGGSRLNRER